MRVLKALKFIKEWTKVQTYKYYIFILYKNLIFKSNIKLIGAATRLDNFGI
jgi:hypothetical protein